MNSDTSAFSREAYELALKHGAEQKAIDKLTTRDALLSILTDANIEADICEDVADTCDLSNLNALAIASGILDAQQIAQFCFLTNDEAEVLLPWLLTTCVGNVHECAKEWWYSVRRVRSIEPAHCHRFNSPIFATITNIYRFGLMLESSAASLLTWLLGARERDVCIFLRSRTLRRLLDSNSHLCS
jgi:hypothetical protein